MRTFTFYLLLAAFAINFGCSQPAKQSAKLGGNWDAFNRQQLENLINQYGKNSGDYNPDQPPYAVFDWDNTSIFLDIQEATLIYQLEHFHFGCTPEVLEEALRTGIDTKVALADQNEAGESITAEQVITDILASYNWLFANYAELGGSGSLSLEQVKENPHYANFTTKVRFLYDAIYNTFSADVSYPWVTYLFSGLDSARVTNMTIETVKWQQNQPIEKISWVSPGAEELAGQSAGQVKITWKNGLRLVPEMQELYHQLRDAGFDVWVCSASFVDVVKGIASFPEFGYNLDASHVIAMELERDSAGVILPEFRKDYFQTQGRGKTAAITRFLAGENGRYGYGPVLIAGDSEGDQDMLADFEDLKAGLIFNRLKGKEKLLGKLSENAVDSYQHNNATYLLQGRDENLGVLIPSQGTVLFGESSGQTLP
ncbi:haloacid dehalogenase-like hydrolase [Maribellus sp. CM-23]|uniref:haloacid dehalogenase-like hydrolase n=1 Tax=Maribellus sp. CM-23 TaxID=2781026 RepID=UPI001F2A9E6B|nr:HAD family hydrolase [Maribellus sp. CM-23]MCE4565459.1 haloacid dehalogenase-like hydrolase [Maribellus sp. CM-23]